MDQKGRALFASNLERHLKRAGMTKAELARRVGVQPSTISDWIACRGFPRLEKMTALVEIFGVTQTELFGVENHDRETISDEEQKILDLFHQVPEEKREFLLSLIQVTIDNLK